MEAVLREIECGREAGVQETLADFNDKVSVLVCVCMSVCVCGISYVVSVCVCYCVMCACVRS